MLLNTFRSEFTKLYTTKSLWWTTGIFLVFSWGWAIMAAKLSGAEMDSVASINTAVVPMGMHLLGMSVIMIQAIMVVTTEYRYGVQTPQYLSNSNRIMVAVVKLVLYAAFAALLSFVGVAGAFFLADTLASGPAADMFNPFEDEVGKRALWAYPAAAAALVLFAQGIGWLLRQTAGSVAVGLIFYLGLDSLLTFIPKIGDKIANFSPFTAFNNWLSQMAPATEAPWGDSYQGFGVVFLVWGLVLWILGVVTLKVRDV